MCRISLTLLSSLCRQEVCSFSTVCMSASLSLMALSMAICWGEESCRMGSITGSCVGAWGIAGRRHCKPKGVSLAGPRGPRGGQRHRKAGGRGGIGGSSEIFIRLRGGKNTPRRHLVDHPPLRDPHTPADGRVPLVSLGVLVAGMQHLH